MATRRLRRRMKRRRLRDFFLIFFLRLDYGCFF
jgi:hypothetical protein